MAGDGYLLLAIDFGWDLPMMPFDDYPRGGRQLLGPLQEVDSRHGLAFELRRITGVTSCAYCGVALRGDAQHSHACVDHVVPVGEAMRLGLPREFAHDIINSVLCCCNCARLSTGYVVPGEMRPPTLYPGAMADLRDRVFVAKKGLIADRGSRERRLVTKGGWPGQRRAA